MSRALEVGTAALISASNPQDAYNDIVKALNSPTPRPLEIEILGKSHPVTPGCNVLHDGSSIGLPKLNLVLAFVVARQIFFRLLKDFKAENFQEIRNATAIILLMDPEHITAANARKRIIQSLQADSKVELSSVLKRELLVIDSFLTSRLHRHTKSPTLWGQRRWLIEIFNSTNLVHDTQWDLENVVLVAADRHPRNYYAWHHLRWLLKSRQTPNIDLKDSSAINNSMILSAVKDWCLRHPTDTSGWSFVLFFLCSIESPTTRLDTSSSISREVLGLATSFRWTHESIWVFLRTMFGSEGIQNTQRLSYFKAVEVVLAAQTTNPKAQKILKTSHDWCVTYSI